MAMRLRIFGSSEGKYPKEWQEFFGNVAKLEKEGSVGALLAAGQACRSVLSALVWSADAMEAKSRSHDFAYADVTQFFRNWGDYANEIGAVRKGLKNKGEEFSDRLVVAKDKMRCVKCTNGISHLTSMCFNKGKVHPRRESARYEQDRSDERDRSTSGFRGDSDKSYRQRKRSPPRYGRRF
jgi:hypothetical protein